MGRRKKSFSRRTTVMLSRELLGWRSIFVEQGIVKREHLSALLDRLLKEYLQNEMIARRLEIREAMNTRRRGGRWERTQMLRLMDNVPPLHTAADYRERHKRAISDEQLQDSRRENSQVTETTGETYRTDNSNEYIED